MTRTVDLSVSGGFWHARTFGTQRVTLSPEVAALLGRATGVEAFTRKDILPQFHASLGYTLERSRFTASFLSGVTPGNGIYLTSQRTSAMIGYSFTGIRKLSLGASARYSQTQSRSISAGKLNNFTFGGGANYSLTRLVNLSTQLDYRSFQTTGVRGREGFTFVLGVLVSRARIPLSIW